MDNVKINVTGRKGGRITATGRSGDTLMEVLRALDDGVPAVCGGNCSCGTCHVYVDAASRDRLPAAQGDELELLKTLSGCRDNSRLSCQVKLSPALDGLSVTIAPEE